MQRHVVGDRADFPPGSSTLVDVNGRSVGVFNVDGALYALRNVCPHHGAPLCLGTVTGRMALTTAPHRYEYQAEPKVLRCPWHGYEFDLRDGRSMLKPESLRVRSYRIEIERGEVVVYA
jgi:nitrite reductase (NADH) small subunit